VADDHAATRLGIQLALQGRGFDVVAEAPDAESAIASVLERRPDLCLLDVRMPGGGINAAAILSEQVPDMPIVMLSVSDADEDLFGALHAGACGYLLKDTDPTSLPATLLGVFRGEAPMPRMLTARLISQFQQRGRESRVRDVDGEMVSLTERESEVLALMRAQVPTKQIASRLGISPTTVRRHISHVVKKLSVPDRDAALHFTASRPA
jgi:DNA-binding NarL/FixJ family response regulator